MTFFIVRHAEKGPGDDPPLLSVGFERARRLSDLLKNNGVGAIYTSRYLRSRQTAHPLAGELHLQAEDYELPANVQDLSPEECIPWAKALFHRIRRDHPEGNVLIISHDVTLPALYRALDPRVAPFRVGPDEFDHLFVVVEGNGAPSLSLSVTY